MADAEAQAGGLLSLTPTGYLAYERGVMARLRYPSAAIADAMLDGVAAAVGRFDPHEWPLLRQQYARQLRAEAAILDQAMEILRQIGAASGLPIMPALRYGAPALRRAADMLAPGLPEARPAALSDSGPVAA